MITCVVASAPTIDSKDADGCILEGQNVALTCQVTYSGTNLMPLVMGWIHYKGLSPDYILSNNTVNASSVHQATFTFTATGPTTDSYACRVSFASPRGVVLPGVQNQSVYTSDVFESSTFASRRVASEKIVYIESIE